MEMEMDKALCGMVERALGLEWGDLALHHQLCDFAAPELFSHL